MSFFEIAERACAGEPATAGEGLAVLRSTDDQLLELVAATSRVRRTYFGTQVKSNYPVNLQSGLCPEVLEYSWLPAPDGQRQAETAEVPNV
ncbi:MAG: hypothetical protein L0K41_01760 [Yaniella sp.]|uniref:hypothetical protein n=1 Tax=Yaniella sp. TaxID=2773929 RepID=UPI00264A3417|nr:hypothetical protein [Yaniella sp.]MDN5742975.1 hypothetical protein [Yaniella sp.]MDN5815623.1 hypothetical protein [Yaniella sp.]MDN5889749.1 hypothetical protein [Yaniella sp.]MDN6147737.1 hypothetical protein [Yaniella sp.]MDN6150485.1 hypothetical protein [Yaniella sp.]